ncbi:MAG: tetratricopeptide repeat protein [Pseudanabaena sp. Salubria-1]|nr:tetratricopeptide repeat protein [Pseudanabaena sp. Salubria-1]
MKRNLSIISSLLILSFLALDLSIPAKSQAQTTPTTCNIEPGEDGLNGIYSEKQLQTLASQITVRVIGDNNGGSGTIFAKKGNSYLVVTNSHILLGVNVDQIRIKTSDGKIYSGKILPETNFGKLDLTVLEFSSNQIYCLPKEIANTTINRDMSVLAAGYSSATGEMLFKTGTVNLISEPSLKAGYAIGYTSDVEQGMSGGPIINSQGSLIGINGRSAYPILNSGYADEDGKMPADAEIQELRKLSWGIPVTTVLAQVKPQILTAYGFPSDPWTVAKKPEELVPLTKLTGWLGEIEQKAKQITVRIDSSSNANGSGVIIAKAGDLYTVLTAAHVLCERENAKEPCGEFDYQILAPNGKQYTVEKSSIKIEEGVDLAVVKFRSQENFQVATLASYPTKDDEYVFTAGYPRLGGKSPWRLTLGKVYSREIGLLATIQSDFQNNADNDSSGRLRGASKLAISLTGGYELVYSSITFGGMSGGPVLDSQGRVIGIHGRSEGQTAIDQKTGDFGSSNGQVQIGYSLGIPVSTFLGIATRLNTQAQKVETTPSPELNTQKVDSIQSAILSVDISKGNTTASQWLERGNQLWRLGRYQESVEAFDQAIKLKPAFIHLAYYGKGLALSQDKKYQETVDAFDQAVKFKPDFVAAWNRQSMAYVNVNKMDKALFAIDQAIQLQPNNPNLYQKRWLVLLILKKYAEAEIAISKAVDLSPRASFYSSRGIVYYKQGKLELALADFNKAILIDSKDAQAYNNRGVVYKQQGKLELALADYSQAILIDSEYAQAYSNRGAVYYKQGKLELALADFNKAILIDSEYAQAYSNRGIVYGKQGKLELALADFNKAILIDSEYAQAYFKRGAVYYKQGKLELALADLNKAILIDSEYADAYSNRGAVYVKQGKLELALADFNKAILINPQNATDYINRGFVYAQQGKLELALADFNKAILIDSEYATAYLNRGLVYVLFSDKQKAREDFQKAAQLFLAQGNTADYEKVMGLLKRL